MERDLLEQIVEARALERRNLDVLHVTRHLLHDHFVFEQTLADALRVGFFLVDLVDRDDHRHARGLGVIDGLDRLRHDPVVGGDHQHDDVGHVGTARAHFGERGVARRVEERDPVAALGLHLIAADVLGDAAGLALHDIGAAQRVEQRGLAMVDVAHDGDDRRTRLERLVRVDVHGRVDIDVAFRHARDVVAEFLDQQLRGVLVDRLIDGDHHAHVEQRLH